MKHALDLDKPYYVYVDGRLVMELLNGEMKDFHVPVGKHTIEVKSDKYHSEQLTFDIGDQEIIEFLVQPDYQNTFFSKLLHQTIYGKQGLKLEKTQDFYI